MKSFCVPHCRQEKRILKSFKFYAKKEKERTKISGGASVTSPAACKALLTVCTFSATRQTKQKTQICWKLEFINSAVHRYLSEAIKAQQYFLPPFFQFIRFYRCTELALSLSLCNILLETITLLKAESQKLLRFNLKQCFVRKRETQRG